jgi:glycosyltransferase involved in cell wall biosynthesis
MMTTTLTSDVSLHNPLISVVVATRNAADTIARCMDSVIGQDYED